MTSIDWVDVDTVDETLVAGLGDSGGYLNVSVAESPTTKTRIGNVAILKNTTWAAYTKGKFDKFPEPPETVTIDTVYVAILVNRIGLSDNGQYRKCPSNPTVFGDLPKVQQYHVDYHVSDNKPLATDCYMFGKTTIRVGSHNCTEVDQCVVTLSLQGIKVVALPIDLEDGNDRETRPDALGETTLASMPEVTANICAMNITDLIMWNRIEDYTREMLTLSYESTWSALTEGVQSNVTSTQRVTVIPPEQLITADVSRAKIYAWLTGDLALWASGLIVLSVQMWAASDSTHVKAIRNTTLAALTIDMNEVVDSMGGKGLCNAVELIESDKRLGILRWNRAQRWHRSLSTKNEHKVQE